jgi:hypothetical protein
LDTVAIIVVFLIAIAQALTILLTIRQERHIKELGRLVDAQRLQIVELKAWSARRNTAQPRFAKSEREPTSLRTALSQPAITPQGLPNTEDELERTTNVINWLNRVAIDYTARRNSGLRRWGMPPPPSTGGPPVTNIRDVESDVPDHACLLGGLD